MKTRVPAGKAFARGRHVLVVEDNALVMLDLEDLLRALGFAGVAGATSAQKALAALSASEFDVAILDFDLAGGTYLEVADVLSRRNIPFLLMSGYGSAVALPENLRNTPICEKPFSIEALSGRLSRLLGQ